MANCSGSQSDHEHSVRPLIRPAKWTRHRIIKKKKKKQSGILSNSLCACNENRESEGERESNGFLLEIEQNTQEFYQTFRMHVTITPKL